MKTLIPIFLYLLSATILACPMCSGTEQEKDQYTVPILASFILITYIPYAIIFRLIKKYRHLEQPPQKVCKKNNSP